jgi:TorA maturation chaperone TorD
MVKVWTDKELMSELSFFFSEAVCQELSLGLNQVQSEPRSWKLAYDALFLVPVKGKSVSPYESFYLEDHFFEGKRVKLLMGRSAQAVEDFIRKSGLDAPLAVQELPDHIGMELLLMAGLAQQEWEAFEREDREGEEIWRERESQFLREHLAKWFKPLARDIRKKTSHPFFKGLALMLEELIEQELQYLGAGAEPKQRKPEKAK